MNSLNAQTAPAWLGTGRRLEDFHLHGLDEHELQTIGAFGVLDGASHYQTKYTGAALLPRGGRLVLDLNAKVKSANGTPQTMPPPNAPTASEEKRMRQRNFLQDRPCLGRKLADDQL